MTKADLIVAIADQLKLPAGRAELIVDQIFDGMVNALKHGEGIEIRGFGSFTIREYKAYEGRNPRTGEKMVIAATRVPAFSAGKQFKEKVVE